MPAHTDRPEPRQRIPLELRGADILLLLRLKHILESEAKATVKTNDVIRLAIRAFAKQHNIAN